MSRTVVQISELAALEGTSLGHSGWHPLTQLCVDQFAEATQDHQWIHVDPVRAAEGPFGTPIAHGLLTLAMLPAMVTEVLAVEGSDLVLNKGFDRVRLAKPVPVGCRVRGEVRVAAVRLRPRDYHEVTLSVSVEVEGQPGAVLKAEMIFLYHQAALVAAG